MNAKKLTLSIFAIIFIVFAAISTIVYDNSNDVGIICYEGSYAEEYAKKHDIDYVNIADSDSYIGILNLENFDYNIDGGKGEIIGYKGESEKIAIPTDIEGIRITKVSEKAFENAKNLKSIYLPKSVNTFEPKVLDRITVHMYKDTELYESLSKDETVTYEIKTVPDSYYVDFYSSDIPFSYNNISDKTIDITMYHAYQTDIIIPESIDGKIVTSISFDALADGVETIIIPATVTNIETDLYESRYDIYFLIGLLMALLGMCFAAGLVLTMNISSKEKLFLQISQFKTAYWLGILSIVLSAVYMFVNLVPDWLVYVLFVVAYGVCTISINKAKTAVALVEGVDEKISTKTQVFKMLTADAEHLMSVSKTMELKAEAKRVYEAIRYSDPMSSDALSEIEGQIKSEFEFFSQAIKSEDLELAKSVSEGLINLIDGRNKKCKALK